MSETKQPSCADLVQQKFNETEQDYKDARDYYDGSQREEHDQFDGYEDLYDYVNQTALSWDYVEKGTFNDSRRSRIRFESYDPTFWYINQERGYFRLQLSWGGPGDEFRIYVDYDKSIDYIEYWYLDWYDGASVRVGSDTESYDICRDFLELSLLNA
mgnify:CR=1 FL=1